MGAFGVNPNMKVWIGTSGFQYSEWKGNFYPEDLAAAKMLPFYAERFSTTEINYTFHRIPAQKTIENWKAQTPEGAAENHPLVEAARLFRHPRILLQNHYRSRRATWPRTVSASADLQKSCGRAEFIPARISRYARSF
jgi:Protein of unknown function DUF72